MPTVVHDAHAQCMHQFLTRKMWRPCTFPLPITKNKNNEYIQWIRPWSWQCAGTLCTSHTVAQSSAPSPSGSSACSSAALTSQQHPPPHQQSRDWGRHTRAPFLHRPHSARWHKDSFPCTVNISMTRPHGAHAPSTPLHSSWTARHWLCSLIGSKCRTGTTTYYAVDDPVDGDHVVQQVNATHLGVVVAVHVGKAGH